MDAANGRAKAELKRGMYQAWYAAALTRTKRMPSLKKLLKDDSDEHPDFEQLAREHEELIKNSTVLVKR